MKNKMESIRKSFTGSKFKNGAYSTLLSVIVILVILIVNLIAGELNLKIDVSTKGMFTLSKETRALGEKIEDEIVLYYMAGKETENSMIKQIVEQYETISPKIKLEAIDPVVHPKFSSQYTSDEVAVNSVIVVNKTKDRNKVVNYNDMLVTEVDYSTYSTNVTGVDVEGQVTSAVQYVTTDKLPVMYAVEGHGEEPVCDAITVSLAKANIETKTLDTLTAKTIPEDCSVLLINGPQYDFTAEEAKLLENYLKNGGNAIVSGLYSTNQTPNFDALLNTYGISFEKGIVVEEDLNHGMPNNPAYLIPLIESHEITDGIADKNIPVVLPIASGIKISESLPETTLVTPILKTSDSAFSKTDVNSSTYEKEEGDVDGPFVLGAAVTEQSGDKETKLVVYSSAYLIDESMVTYDQFANSDLFLNTVRWMSDTKEALSIPTKSLEQTYLTVNAAQVQFYSIIAVVLLPLIFLAVGTFVTLRRRRGR